MIVEGVKLTLLGVGVVYLFLTLLVVVIKISSRVLKSYTEREEAAYMAVPVQRTANRRAEDEQQRIMAVISAAVAAHRARTASSAGTEYLSRQVATPVERIAASPPSRPNPVFAEGKKAPPHAGTMFFKDMRSLHGFLRLR